MLAAIQVLRDKHASAATGRNRSLTMPGWESRRSAFGAKMKMGAQASVQLEKGCSDQSGSDIRVGGIWNVECVAPDGTVRWCDVAKNMCCTAALDNLLNVYFGGATPLAGTGYTILSLGLIDNTAFSSLQAGDTLGSHSGWAEGTYYSNTTRPLWVPSASTGGSNSIVNANTTNFNINANTKSVNGLFLVLDVSAAQVPGTTSTGLLFATASFSGGVQGCNSGDTLKCTYTMSASTG